MAAVKEAADKSNNMLSTMRSNMAKLGKPDAAESLARNLQELSENYQLR